MSLKHKLRFMPNGLAVLAGAAAGLWLDYQLRPDGGGLYYLFGSAAIGAVVGYWVWRDIRGLYKACRAGAARYIVVWVVVGGLAGGLLGLLIRYFGGQAAEQLPVLLGSTWTASWLRCTILGAVLGLLEAGDYYYGATSRAG